MTKAGLTRPHHVCSWCQIKIKERDAGSLSAVRVRPLKCGEAGCSIRAVAVRGRGRCQSQDSGKRGGLPPSSSSSFQSAFIAGSLGVLAFSFIEDIYL